MAWAPDYLDLEVLKDYLKIEHADDDAVLQSIIGTSSRVIDRHTGRQFGQVAAPELRQYTPWWNRRRGRWIVTTDDLQDVTGLVIMVRGVEVTGTPEPLNAVAEGKAYTRIVLDASAVACGEDGEASITALWGWSAFPNAVVDACELQSSRFFARRDSPYGIAGSPDQGSELRLLARVDPDVGVMLGDYYRPRRPR